MGDHQLELQAVHLREQQRVGLRDGERASTRPCPSSGEPRGAGSRTTRSTLTRLPLPVRSMAHSGAPASTRAIISVGSDGDRRRRGLLVLHAACGSYTRTPETRASWPCDPAGRPRARSPGRAGRTRTRSSGRAHRRASAAALPEMPRSRARTGTIRRARPMTSSTMAGWRAAGVGLGACEYYAGRGARNVWRRSATEEMGAGVVHARTRRDVLPVTRVGRPAIPPRRQDAR